MITTWQQDVVNYQQHLIINFFKSIPDPEGTIKIILWLILQHDVAINTLQQDVDINILSTIMLYPNISIMIVVYIIVNDVVINILPQWLLFISYMDSNYQSYPKSSLSILN